MLLKYNFIADCQKNVYSDLGHPNRKKPLKCIQMLLSKFMALCLIFTVKAGSCRSNCGTKVTKAEQITNFGSWLIVLFKSPQQQHSYFISLHPQSQLWHYQSSVLFERHHSPLAVNYGSHTTFLSSLLNQSHLFSWY